MMLMYIARRTVWEALRNTHPVNFVILFTNDGYLLVGFGVGGELVIGCIDNLIYGLR